MLTQPGVLVAEPFYVDVSDDAPWDPAGSAVPGEGHRPGRPDPRQTQIRTGQRGSARATPLPPPAPRRDRQLVFLTVSRSPRQRSRSCNDREAIHQRNDATAQKLTAQAQGMLAGTAPGGDARAFQHILAARTLTAPDDGVLYTAVVQRASTVKIITAPRMRWTVWRVWCSAPTGIGWPAPASIGRCGCGTPTPANQSANR